MNRTPRLADRTAVVTGAGSGIGAAAARLMAAEGASVLVADFDTDAAERTAGAITAAGGRAEALHVDVTDDASVQRMADTAQDVFGRLDVVCNHVGGTNPRKDLDLLHLDMDEFQRGVDRNMRATLTGCRSALPYLIEAGGGAIVNTASVAALAGDALQITYGAVKAAVVSMTRYVAVQYGPQGVRCNAVAPGAVRTPALEDNLGAAEIDGIVARNALPYLGTPEDIAEVMLFLASDASRYLTGQLLVADGGMTMQSPAAPARRAALAGDGG